MLNPDGNVGGSGEGTFTPGAETDVAFTLETRTAQRYIPVGSVFVYHWELVDRAGDTLQTPDREFTFLDGRYNWQQRTDGRTTVFWYGRGEDRAMGALRATQQALEQVGSLLETEVPYPIRLVVYASESDGELAMRPRGRVFDELVTTGGQRVAPDLLLVFTPDSDVVRHEVAHIVTHVAGDGPFTSLPAWLDEGTAVYAQSSPGAGYSVAVDFAVVTDNPLSLRSMQAASNRVDQINLFYGQSYSTVDFLVETFGQEQFAELFRVHFGGLPIDRALEEVYGLDQNGLYNAWRETHGLDRLALATPAAGSGAPPVEATRAPIGVAAPGGAATPATAPPSPRETGGDADTDATPAAVASESDSNATAGIAVLAGTLVIVVVLGGGAFMLMRRSGGRAS